MISFINNTLSFLTIIVDIFIVFGIGYFLIYRKDKDNKIIGFLARNGLLIALLVTLFSSLGSLFYSEILKLEPCILCWWQRIFMYPQIFILGLALFKKDVKIINYSLLLTIIGLLIAGYHNYIYYTSEISAVCSPQAIDKVSCLERYNIFKLNYMSIPLMSLTAFLSIFIILIIMKNKYE